MLKANGGTGCHDSQVKSPWHRSMASRASRAASILASNRASMAASMANSILSVERPRGKKGYPARDPRKPLEPKCPPPPRITWTTHNYPTCQGKGGVLSPMTSSVTMQALRTYELKRVSSLPGGLLNPQKVERANHEHFASGGLGCGSNVQASTR